MLNLLKAVKREQHSKIRVLNLLSVLEKDLESGEYTYAELRDRLDAYSQMIHATHPEAKLLLFRLREVKEKLAFKEESLSYHALNV